MPKIKVIRKNRWICGDVKDVKDTIACEMLVHTENTKKELAGMCNRGDVIVHDPALFAKATITVTVEWEDE